MTTVTLMFPRFRELRHYCWTRDTHTHLISMTNLIRSAKSGNDWTLNDLESYNITLSQVDVVPFFGLQVGDDRFAIYSPWKD
jgi:hypothetical protein